MTFKSPQLWADTARMDAAQHLARAATYAAKGEEYYRRAAEEMIAAKAADPALSNRAIAREIGRSHRWVNGILAWAAGTDGSTPVPETPFAGQRASAHNRFGNRSPDAEMYDGEKASNLYYTPPSVLVAARKVLGGRIDLDPASDTKANEVVNAKRIFTKRSRPSSLAREWIARRVWMNPPYNPAGTAGEFVKHLVGQYKCGNVEAAIVLVSGYSFDANWFQALFRYQVCFTSASAGVRREFWRPEDLPQGEPNVGPAIIYLGPETERFDREFERFGNVVTKSDFYVPEPDDFPMPFAAAGEGDRL
jgi:hypothetical protein